MAKKKDEHHGGAWKVAYADFVTAMMALFIVLWIIAPEPNDNKIVYEDEIDTAPPEETKAQNAEQQTPGLKPGDKEGSNGAAQRKKDLQFIADELIKLLKVVDTDPEPPVDVKLVNETIKVTLYDRAQKPFFKTGTSDLTEWGDFVLKTMSSVAVKHSMSLLLDGHTAKGFSVAGDRVDFGPWELSAERAAVSRRRMINYDLPKDQIVRINGYADTRPLDGMAPNMSANQRLTVHMGIR
jgi:chemotaxis protein MotB